MHPDIYTTTLDDSAVPAAAERRAALNDGDGVYRGNELVDDMTVRAEGDDEGSRIVDITFARFNVWTRIRSYWEGDFMETVERGAYARTFAERRDLIRCLYDHGYDPTIGDKALGPVRELYEGEIGPRMVVEFLDRPYAEDILAGIRHELYGASYRFGIVREEWNDDPGESDHNPLGLPERRIFEVRVAEAGPVSFPADEGTQGLVTARSLTDHFRGLAAQRSARRGATQIADQTSEEPPPARASSPSTGERAQTAAAFRNRFIHPKH